MPVDVCAEGFPADPDFPQLKIASDPELMLEDFRRHLKPVSSRHCQIQECRPYRFRCRQSSSRCVLQYTLRVLEPGAGREWNRWVTGLVYARPGEAQRLCQEMQAADPLREIPADWLAFEPVEFIPELQMLVQVFPYDRKLPNLCRVLGEGLGGLEPLLLARLGPGTWRTEQRTIEPTRYRTELGAALKYTMKASETLRARSQTGRWYLKVYRNQQGEETFQLLRSLAEKTSAGQQPFSVVNPVAYLSELRTLVLEEAAGTSLQEVLLREADPASALRAVARAVAAFNLDEFEVTRHHSIDDQFADVKRAASLLEWACPEARAEIKALTAAVVSGLGPVPPAPIHRDLKTEHIFLSGDRVIFIDLDSVARGDPVRDPAHLFAHIVVRVGLDSMSREQALTAARGFLEEYFRRVPKSWRERFPVHCAGALIEVAGGIFKRQEPLWLDKVTAALEEAQQALSGGLT